MKLSRQKRSLITRSELFYIGLLLLATAGAMSHMRHEEPGAFSSGVFGFIASSILTLSAILGSAALLISMYWKRVEISQSHKVQDSTFEAQ